jgi:RimJ/RimL family protein N-acetyltransferase
MTSKSQKNQLGQSIGLDIANWQACHLPSKSVMEGHYCKLEPVDINNHAEGLFESFAEDSNNRNWTYLPYGPFEDLASFTDWLEQACVGDDPLFYVVINQSNNEIVGMASYLRINPRVGVIEVGHIHFSPKMQQTPMATETMYLMMARVFDELGYRRYEWKCDALNAPSKKSATRFGFSYEGLFRQATMYKGRNRDTAWYAIIDKDWPKIKNAYQTWLNPNNFDKNGKQKTRLSC